MSFETTQLSIEFPVTYALEPAPESPRGVLVLHGFSDHARAAKKRLLGVQPLPGFTVLSPNALFPSPVRDGERFKEAYSWYFRDPRTGEQMSSPEFAAAACLQLIDRLALSRLRWTVLGFSQGGFFAPHLVRAGLNARTLVTVGSAYRPEAYAGLPADVRVYALHGTADQEVPYDIARSSFEEIQKMGYGARFHSLPEVGHRLDDAGREIVRAILAEDR